MVFLQHGSTEAIEGKIPPSQVQLGSKQLTPVGKESSTFYPKKPTHTFLELDPGNLEIALNNLEIALNSSEQL